MGEGIINPSTSQFFDFLIDIGLYILADGLIRPQFRQQIIMLLSTQLNLNLSHIVVVYCLRLYSQASLACCSICTCLKASSRVACDDGRPNESRTSRADSCMLWKSESRNVCSSIFYIVSVIVNHRQDPRGKPLSGNRIIYLLQLVHGVVKS